MTEADTVNSMSYTGYMHFYVCQKMLENTHSRSLLWIVHSGPFYFHSLGKMQMASMYHHLDYLHSTLAPEHVFWLLPVRLIWAGAGKKVHTLTEHFLLYI